MNSRDYWEVGCTENTYNPYLRLEFLKENIQEVVLRNGHILVAKLKNGDELILCDTGNSAGWALLDLCVLINKNIQEKIMPNNKMTVSQALSLISSDSQIGYQEAAKVLREYIQELESKLKSTENQS